MSSALPQLLRFSSEIISGRGAILVLEMGEAQAGLQAERDLGLHIGELLLDQLIGRQRAAELLAVQRVLAGRVPAELGRAQRAPGDAEAGVVEAAEGALETADIGQQILLGDLHILHDDLRR